MNVPDPANLQPPVGQKKSSWGPELSAGGMLALGLGVLFGGSAVLAGAKAAVDPPKLGPEDGLTFGWIFAATLPLAVGATVFSWYFSHKTRTKEPMSGMGLLGLGALCAVGSLWLSSWAVDAGVKSAIESALGYLPSPDNTEPPAEWPGWVETYWTAGGGTPLAIIQRGLGSYLTAFGPILFVASIAVGAYAGWCASKVSADQ